MVCIVIQLFMLFKGLECSWESGDSRLCVLFKLLQVGTVFSPVPFLLFVCRLLLLAPGVMVVRVRFRVGKTPHLFHLLGCLSLFRVRC